MAYENYSFVSWSDGTPITSARLQQMSTNIDQVKTALSTSYSGYKNVLINAGMSIDQRNSGSALTINNTSLTTMTYTVDRWFAYYKGNTSVSGQRITSSAPDQYAYQFTGSGTPTEIGFGQRIEQLNSYHLAGQQVTLSAYLACTTLSTVSWVAYYANTTDTFGTINTPTKTQIATGNFTVSSSLNRYQTSFVIPSAATTGIEILFYVGALTSGTWTIDAVQLEQGSSASIFERRPYSLELSLCQRYYHRITSPSAGTTRFGMGQCTSTTSATILTQFPVTMRTSPSALEQSGTVTHYAVTSSTGTTVACATTVPTFGTSNQYMATTVFTTASGLTAGNATMGIANSTASAYLGWSVEL